MSINIKVSGMSCMHCVASVKSALCELDGVNSADVSLENGCACVDYDESKVSPEAMKSAIDDIGFEASL